MSDDGPVKQLSDLQLAVMRTLWNSGEQSAAQVQEALRPERALALTTVATILSRLEKQGIVAHRAEGRVHLYRAMVSERAVRRSMVASLIETLFQGDSQALVNHLLHESELNADDLAAARVLLEQQERKDRDHDQS